MRTVPPPRAPHHLRHGSVGCNAKYLGTGLSPEGDTEMMTLNRPLQEIKGVVKMTLDVTAADIGESAVPMAVAPPASPSTAADSG